MSITNRWIVQHLVAGVWSCEKKHNICKKLTKRGWSPYGNMVDFDILQFACHGVSGRTPIWCITSTWHGCDKSEWIIRIRLRAKLVCLSAVISGVPRAECQKSFKFEELKFSGDEWVGLYFHYSSEPRTCCKPMEANSKVTAMFMKTLHSALSEGVSLPQAFQQAMTSVKQKPAAFWAIGTLSDYLSRNDLRIVIRRIKM